MKEKIKIQIVICVFLFSFCTLPGQDIHFSQYYRTPLLVNPAMTGIFNGNVRLLLNHKDQWRSVGPYSTSGFSYDMSFLKKNWDKGFLAGGVAAYTDKVGSFKLSTTNILLSLSSTISLNKENLVSAGLQGGFVQQSIDNAQLRWGNQYDPASANGFNAGLASNENLFENQNFLDFTLGVAWNYGKNVSSFAGGRQLRANVGFAIQHLNRPELELTGIPEKIYSKLAAHGGLYIGIENTNIALLPSVLYNAQGPAQEINGGLMVRYTIKEGSKYTGFFKETALLLGGNYRVGDAIIPAVLVEFTNYALGISYDVNTSSLSSASNMKGGFEISLSYINPNPFRSQSGNKSVRFL